MINSSNTQKPQLSVITDEISQDLDHALELIQSFKIESVEIRNVWNKNIALLSDEELNRLKLALEKRNMRLAVVCSPFAKCYLPKSWLATSQGTSFSRNPEYNLSFFDRIVRIANLFETKYIRIFNFFKEKPKFREEQWQQMLDSLRPFIEKAEKANKVLLLENEQITFAETIAHTLRFFDEIGNSPAIKLNLDPGNFFSAHEPVTPDAYEPFYQRELVAHIHVKDPKFRIPFAGSFFDVVGEGKINYKALFQQAIEHNYTGLFSLETHAPRNKEKISTKSLKNLTEMLTKL